MSESREKPWGRSTLHFSNDVTELLEIDVRPGGFCSRHYHQDRENLFWVFSGSLMVACGVGLETVVTLNPGTKPWVVATTVHHRFWSPGGCIAYELYRVLPGMIHRTDDIVRLEDGGIWTHDQFLNSHSPGPKPPFRIPT